MSSTVVAELRELIAFPTISANPVLGIASRLAQQAEDLGMRVERFDDPSDSGKTNIVATAGPSVEGGLVITGHMDVVPVAGQPWSSDPFVLTERGGMLYGRGTADMKGFIAATMVALRGLDLRRLKVPITLIWTHDEEVGCYGSAKLADELLRSSRRLPRDCLVGEPTGFQVLRMHAGHVAGRVTATGAAAHSAFPELGANAIEAAASAVLCLRSLAAELAAERHPAEGLERDFVPLNVGLVAGGSAVNIVPDACDVQFGFRPLPGMGHEQLWQRVEAALASAELPRGTALATELIRVTPSLLTPADTPLIAQLMAHADSSQVGAAGFATDGGNLARCGCEPVVFGPGSIQVAHQADEHVSIEALHRAVSIVRSLVALRCGASA